MRWLEILILVISFLVMFIGLIGSIVPMIPGPPLVLAGVFIYAVFTKFTVVGWKILVVLSVLAALGVFLDYSASLVGARKFGATRLSIWLGALGLLVGVVMIFFGFPWAIIVGPIVGVGIGEAIAKRKAIPAVRASAGSMIGVFVGVIVKFVICLAMITIFILALVL